MKKFLFALLLGAHALAGQTMLENGTNKLNLLGCTIQSGTIKITGTGNIQANKAFFNAETTLEELDLNFHVRVDSLNDDEDFRFGIGKYSGIAGTMVEFGTSGGATKIWVSKLNGTTPTLAAQYILPFDLDIGTDYKIRIGKRIRKLEIVIASAIDSADYFIEDTLSYPTPFFGCLWGRPFIGCVSGTISVTDFNMTTPFVLNPRLMVWGDSFIEGNSLDSDQQRYVSLIKDSIGHQNIAITGRGGESSVTINTRFPIESKWFQGSRYALLAIGVNDNDFSTWKTNTQKDIDSLKQYNIIPILATLSPRADRLPFISQVNTWIRTVYNGAYIDLTKAISTSSENHWAPGMGITDSIHPSAAGNLAIYNRITIEAPYIFRDIAAFNIDYINETTFEPLGDSLIYSALSGFSTYTTGSNAVIPVVPGSTVFFKDTVATPGINTLYAILAAPPRPARPTSPSVDGGTSAFDWTNNPDFINVSDYEYSFDSGATWTTCSAKPIVSPGTITLQLRVKATADNFKSEILYFDTTHTAIASLTKPTINVYPNPVSDLLYIKNITEETMLTVYSIDGQMVDALLLNGNETNTFDVGKLSAGFYIFKLNNKTLNQSFRIVKK